MKSWGCELILVLVTSLGIGSLFAAERPKIGGFWGEEYKKLTCKWIPHCIREMEEDGEGEEMLNLVATAEKLAGKTPSVKFKGCPWSDAYPYNTVEAACLALEIDPGSDREWQAAQAYLRLKIEEWIPIFLAAQEPCGYIHSFHDLNGREHFHNLFDHEFYVMGYFIEMGIAHYRMTGGQDRRLFDAAIRCADHLDSVFGPPPKRTWMNGHPGLELALQRLSDATGDPKYAALARFFVLHQNSQSEHNSYNQSDVPAAAMREAKGHAVRANYFYTAMARIDETKEAAAALFNSIVDRKYYLTGGVGSVPGSEAYGADYDLPQSAYAESCAGCGLAFFARNMVEVDREKAEAVYERVLYNNVLGAVSRQGTRFYYQNPLSSTDLRTAWHGCPCCVGNIPRALLALKDHLVRLDDNVLYVDHYMDVRGLPVGDYRVDMETAYPVEGKVKLTVRNAAGEVVPPAKIVARYPNRTESALYHAEPVVEHGYREVETEFELPLPLQTVTADERVAACRGKTAKQKGPLVMSFERRHGMKAAPTMVPNYDRLNEGGFSEVWTGPRPVRQVLDEVEIGDPESEKSHAFAGAETSTGPFGGGMYRHAYGDKGWFAYQLKCNPRQPMELVATYWGGDDGGRNFAVLVDGVEIAREALKRQGDGNDFYEKVYPVPEVLTTGKTTLTVKFSGVRGTGIVGGVFGLATTPRQTR